VEIKGQRFLIEAIGILAARGIWVELWLAGKGPAEETLRDLVRKRELVDQVVFMGQVSHSDLISFYRDGKVSLVALASSIEGIPVALMEAMSYRVPVVATDVGGTAELLGDGAGMLVPYGDPQALADSIQRVLRTPELARKLGEAGRRKVQDEFFVEKVVSRTVERFQHPPPGRLRRAQAGS
jgi:glycosyltransferase involved in cell wall biosynthesis